MGGWHRNDDYKKTLHGPDVTVTASLTNYVQDVLLCPPPWSPGHRACATPIRRRLRNEDETFIFGNYGTNVAGKFLAIHRLYNR